MTRLTVAIRVRPLSDREVAAKSVSIVSVENGRTVSVTNIKVPEQNAGDSRERVRRFTFDYCFDTPSTQEDVFQNIGKEIGKAIKKRFHSCVLAYGQSSTGKTHTMIGDESDVGLAPRLCENIFGYLAETAVGSEAENMCATVSYLEIYNEKVRDLLHPEVSADQNVSLKVREHPKKGPYVQGLSERKAVDSTDLLNYLQIGNANRRIATTNINPRSSRSHSVFTITCIGGVKLRLVDLAGSERAGSRSHTTPLFREGANINKSLVALRNVISALADGSRSTRLVRKRFIPYRDSILTWLLKDTLGGNSKTILISTISPSSTCYNETVNTLRFGQTAKQIVVQPMVIEDPKEKIIRELRTEIAKLQELLAQANFNKEFLPERKTSEENFVAWEKLEELEFNCDSGVASFNNSFEEESVSVLSEEEKSVGEVSFEEEVCVLEKPVVINLPVLQSCEEFCSGKFEEELIPVMEVTSNTVKPKPPLPLRRTYSVDHKMNAKPSKMFGSHEVLPTVSKTDKVKKTVPPNSRKQSLDKPIPSAKTTPKKTDKPLLKPEKSVVTEGKTVKPETKSKVDSHRRMAIKPRSQIVAAVTHRLYNKVKKKEVATDTDDFNRPKEPPKELSICSNARLRLQELTQKALKAHRRKNEETQTDLFPVLRVKEISTDVDDLKVVLAEITDAEIETDVIETNDVGTNCSYLDSFGNANFDQKSSLVLTRTCGTSTENLFEPKSQPNLISFTKYLQPQPEPKFEIITHPCTTNPIYTSSVNININHNYINKPNDNLSDDSLEEEYPQPNVSFPPDLISNHNSLEQHLHEPSTSSVNSNRKILKDVRYASINTIPEEFEVNEDFCANIKDSCVANCSLIPLCEESVDSIDLQTVFATETRLEDSAERVKIFYASAPERFSANVIFERCLEKSLVSIPPVVLNCESSGFRKSIMKPCSDSSDESVFNDFENIPDSLNYYYEKKKVRFNEPPIKNETMFEAMSSFMQEVTTLMTNLTRVANKFESALPSEQSYDVQVTVNDVQGLSRPRTKRKKEHKHKKSNRISSCYATTQTSPVRRCETSTETEDFPVNKYESLVEDSCDRLEKLVDKSSEPRRSDSAYDNLHKFPQPFSITTGWNYKPNLGEDSSLDSNLAFSDYGSLPRRKYKRERISSCSPSHYLRQLTTMRKQIVESSREELLNETHMHV